MYRFLHRWIYSSLVPCTNSYNVGTKDSLLSPFKRGHRPLFKQTRFSTTPDNYRPADNLKYEYLATLKTLWFILSKFTGNIRKENLKLDMILLLKHIFPLNLCLVMAESRKPFWDPGLTSPYWTAVDKERYNQKYLKLKTSWNGFHLI